MNPMNGQEITASRNQLTVEMGLPRNAEYDALIKKLFTEQTP
jgi:hypothetical protein